MTCYMLTWREGRARPASVSRLSETSAIPSSVRRSRAGRASGLKRAARVSSPSPLHSSRSRILHHKILTKKKQKKSNVMQQRSPGCVRKNPAVIGTHGDHQVRQQASKITPSFLTA